MRLKIGHFRYTVRGMGDEEAEERACCGICFCESQVIGIWTGQSPASQADTLLHEIMHAVIHTFGYLHADATMSEEDICTRMSPGLCMVLRDNPKLAPLLMNALCFNQPIV